MSKGQRRLNSFISDVFSSDDYRLRVTQKADGNSVSYEDTSFVTGDSPAVLDVNTDLGRNGKDGYMINDGAGNILVEFSNNGTTYGGQHTTKSGEILSVTDLDIDRIRLTWVTNSSYRIFVV